MAVTRVVLRFLDENDVGANDNLGYRVYRKEFEDPCPNGVPDPVYFRKQVSPVPEGKQEIEYIDDDNIEEGKSYYYRISFTRGSGVNFEEAMSRNVIGPVVVRSAYSLAYEGTIPGPNSGVPNFTSLAPLLHYDAEQEMIDLGYDYEYKTTEYIKNRSTKYDISANTGGQFHLEYWNKYSFEGAAQSTDKVWLQNDNINITYNKDIGAVYNTNQVESSIISKWEEPDEFIGNIIFDQGCVSFMVLGGACQHSSRPESLGEPYSFHHGNSFAGTLFFSNNRVSFNTNLYDGKFNEDGSPKVNQNWANRWSDGKKWQHPSPLFDQHDPARPYSMCPGISHASLPYSLGGYINAGKIYNYLYSGADSRSISRNASITSEGAIDSLHLFVKVIYPDGSSSVYQNGKLLIHEDEPLKAYGVIPENGYIENLGLAQAGEEFSIGVYPMMSTRQSISMFGAGVANFAEAIFYPEKISTEDFFRCIAYFQDKYQTLENQEAYPGY